MSINYEDLEKEYGTLIVRTIPPNANIKVENSDKSINIKKMTPAIFDLIPEKLPYRISIKMDGYEDYTQKLIIRKGAEIRIKIVLTKFERVEAGKIDEM